MAIARGGMATVHLGRTLGDGGFARTVAVKQLHAQYAAEPIFTNSFLEEARVVARIHHPNVVPTLDLIAEDDELFIVMEYVEGDALSHLLDAADEPMDPAIALAIASDFLRGLDAAHNATNEAGRTLSLVHRDISPQNVLVGVDGFARVVDFGIARARGRMSTTAEGEIRGKVAYMAPEQLLGIEVDRRADIYASCVVLWEMLSGQRLISGRSMAELAHKAMNLKPQTPSEARGESLPEGLDDVVMRGLARDVDDRWPTAQELADALHAIGTAPPGAVSRYVKAHAAESLEERAALRAKIDQAPLPDMTDYGDVGRVFAADPEEPRLVPSVPPAPLESRPVTDEETEVASTPPASPQPELISDAGTVDPPTGAAVALGTLEPRPAADAGPRLGLLAGVLGCLAIGGGLAFFVASGGSPSAPGPEVVTSTSTQRQPPPAASATATPSSTASASAPAPSASAPLPALSAREPKPMPPPTARTRATPQVPPRPRRAPRPAPPPTPKGWSWGRE